MMMDYKKGGEKEMEYLRTRQLLKDCIRSKYRKDSNDINNLINSTSDNYGSFFGPSQPCISERVIEEGKLVEFQNMTTNFINSHLPDEAKNRCFMKIGGADTHKTSAALNNDQVVPVQVQSKIKMLKESRDYSFLFSNDDDAAAKHPLHDQTTAQAVLSGSSQQPVVTVSKTSEESKNKVNSSDHHKQTSSVLLPKTPRPWPPNHAKVKMVVHCHESKKEINKSSDVVVSKQPAANSSSSSSSSKMKKKKPNHEPIVDYSSVIRKIFRYDRSKYGKDYDDDRTMVSNFTDILKEEKRSERLGKKEDEEERMMALEMERKEKKLNQSKKRKSQAHKNGRLQLS